MSVRRREEEEVSDYEGRGMCVRISMDIVTVHRVGTLLCCYMRTQRVPDPLYLIRTYSSH
jgi:hypothetical protein